MKGIQNEKFISRKLIVIHVSSLCHWKGKLCKFFFHAELISMCQLVTFDKLSSDVDHTGTGSMSVVASRVAISYSYPTSF
jgi:hypothetical protein